MANWFRIEYKDKATLKTKSMSGFNNCKILQNTIKDMVEDGTARLAEIRVIEESDRFNQIDVTTWQVGQAKKKIRKAFL